MPCSPDRSPADQRVQLNTESDLAVQILRGDRKSISRAISLVENRETGYAELLKEIYPHTGKAFVIGVTGPPGTGKSSLVDKLVRVFRARDLRVAVLAVDPTSPISGGAILGDRVRMLGHTLDKDVYIRSMASRGDEGGLSKAAKNAVRILDAAGNDLIFVETVGIGQAEIEVVKVANLIVVVLMPELGDEIQAVKAGLMEIGDIFMVNKSDLPGADRVIYNLEPVLSEKRSGWKQKALQVSANTGMGIEEAATTILEFRDAMVDSPALKMELKRRLKDEIIENILLSVSDSLRKQLSEDEKLREMVDLALERKADPETIARTVLKQYTFSRGNP